MHKQYKNTEYDIYSDGKCFSHKTNKFLTPQMSVKYPTYNLTFPDGKKRKIKVHRMVAEIFVNNPENKTCVNHIDGNTHNFHYSNLEWVNESENSKHAIDMGLKKIGNQIPNYTPKPESTDWMPVPEYPSYCISNIGEVMNISTKRILKPVVSNSGYYEVNLWKKGKGKTVRVHRVVYMAFTGDLNLDNYVINHIDGNKLNNNINNLEKISYLENNLHAEYVIKSHNCAKAVYQLNKNNDIIGEYESIGKATRATGINNISRAIKTKKMAGGFYWKIKE